LESDPNCKQSDLFVNKQKTVLLVNNPKLVLFVNNQTLVLFINNKRTNQSSAIVVVSDQVNGKDQLLSNSE
jgi:hypothetical protein